MTQAEIEKEAEEYAGKIYTIPISWRHEDGFEVLAKAREQITATFIAGAEYARAKWIRCSERLPERGETVLLFDIDDYTVMTFIEDGEFGPTWTDSGDVTSDSRQCHGGYWMPLPQAPETESKDKEQEK